tara:strand:+ start:948 stop:1748 length:801 start_codon:yes stop_codon:yes gene_type:complete
MKKINYLMRRQSTGEADPAKVSFVASTSNPDRYGDIIDQDGWSLDAYRQNPIVLLNHDSSQLPIARGHVEVKNNQLVIDVEFDMDDPRGAEVARKTQKGFMNAVSVGFQPLQSALRAELPADNPYHAKSGQYFKSAELLEVSIVTIPANGEATMITQKQFNEFKSTMIDEIRSIIRSEIADQPELKIKHILEISEEDDRILISFAKGKPEMEEPEMDEEEMEEEAFDSEDSTEDMPKAYGDHDDDDDDEKKNFEINKIAELFAQIL